MNFSVGKMFPTILKSKDFTIASFNFRYWYNRKNFIDNDILKNNDILKTALALDSNNESKSETEELLNVIIICMQVSQLRGQTKKSNPNRKLRK